MIGKSERLWISIGSTALVQVTSAGLLFLLGLVMARLLGPVGLGAYEFVDAWLEILILFAMLGFDRLLLRQVATYATQEQWGLLRGIIDFARRRTFALSLVFSLIVGVLINLFFSQSTLRFVDDTDLLALTKLLPNYENWLVITTFWMGMAILPLRVLLKSYQVVMQGLKHVVLAFLPDYLLRPVLLLGIVLMVSLVVRPLQPQIVMGIHLFSVFLVTGLALIIFHRLQPQAIQSVTPSHETKSWMQEALPFMLISGMSLLNLRGGAIAIGLVTDLETVALYSVTVRTSYTISLILSATSAVVAPRLAILYTTDDMEALQRLVTWSTRLIAGVALPISLLYIFFGDTILGLFGPSFRDAHGALIILVIGQMFSACTGVVGWVVIMSGHERRFAQFITISAIFHLFGILILGSSFGLLGAALATAVSNGLATLLMAIFAYRRLKINPTFF